MTRDRISFTLKIPTPKLKDQKRKHEKRKLQGKNCFVCGYENPSGLKLPFYYNGESVMADFLPGEEYCGYEGIVHGGIISALADEAMMYLLWASKTKATTAEIVMRYHNFAKTGEPLRIVAELESKSPRLITAICRLHNDRDVRIATAKGKFLPFKGEDINIFKKEF